MAPEVLRSRGSTPYGFKADGELIIAIFDVILRDIELI